VNTRSRFESASVAFGVMPCQSASPPYPSYVRWFSAVLLLLPVRIHGDPDPIRKRSAGDSHNKLESPILEDGLLFVPYSRGHHGGGEGDGKKRTAGSRRLGGGSSSSTLLVKILAPAMVSVLVCRIGQWSTAANLCLAGDLSGQKAAPWSVGARCSVMTAQVIPPGIDA